MAKLLAWGSESWPHVGPPPPQPGLIRPRVEHARMRRRDHLVLKLCFGYPVATGELEW